MTFRERFENDLNVDSFARKVFKPSEVHIHRCPYEVVYGLTKTAVAQLKEGCWPRNYSCDDCWDQEIPEEEEAT